MSNILHVTDADFDALVLQADLPVLLDFWAPWCGPCLSIAPSLEALAQEYEGRAIIAKLNVDDNPLVASDYGIRSIPTLMVFVSGKVEETLIGELPKSQFNAVLDKYI